MNPSISFPIEGNCINLTIVEVKEQHEKEKQLYDIQHSNGIVDIFEGIYNSKTTIDLEDIFDICQKQAKRIFIFGRAGIGKSTFCRHIVYQWVTGSHWPKDQLLALIPLRHLTIENYPLLPPGQNYSLVDLIKEEVFQNDLSEKDEMLLKKQFDINKTLWILDGYDEIVQNVPPHLKCILKQLLRTPYHIITSRPYLVNTLSYEVQMEITGFSDKNIKEYVQQFFKQIKDECNDAPNTSETVLKLLRSNSSIWGVAHIPVNLELICSVWSNEDLSKTKQLTITSFYSTIIEWLCRRYMAAQNIIIQKIRKSEIYQCCQKELAFLELLAFDAMKTNTVIIPPSSLEKALDEVSVSFDGHPHILNIGILKSINKQGIGTQIEPGKDYYFVHFSFQQYFAARYLANALKGSSIETAIECIKDQKYSQRYALVFTFLSGLLYGNDAKECLNLFWNNILGKSSDLLGVQQMELVISCIEEISDKSILSRHTELLEWIGNCIKYSYSTKSKPIRRQLLQSLRKAQSVICQQTIINVLIDLLQCNDILIKAGVLFFISELAILNPSNGLITSITAALNDKNEEVRANACKALGKLDRKTTTDEVIDKLVCALGDKDENVRCYACKALGKMDRKALTNEVIIKLVSALGDESAFVQEKACDVLSKLGQEMTMDLVIGNLMRVIGGADEYVRANASKTLGNIGEKAATDEVIHRLVSVLRDEYENVRANACEALGKMGAKVATNEVIRKLMNALDDHDKNVRANACYALGSICEKSATNEVISKLVSVLGDNEEDARWNACEALGKIGEKATTNEVISPLLSALEDENEYVRVYAGEALKNLDKKLVATEVISRLVTVPEDQDESIRETTRETLEITDKLTARNEVIYKLVSALGDEDKNVRRRACETLGKMCEKKSRRVK